MELDGGEGQAVEDGGLGQEVFAALAWEAEDEVPAHGQAAPGGGADGRLGAGEVVAAVDEAEGAVVAALDAVLHSHIVLLGIVRQEVEHRAVHAIGARAHHQAHHPGVAQGLVVALAQHLHGGVGVAVGLEVGQVDRGRTVAAAVESDALVELRGDGGHPPQVGGAEGLVGAEGAAAGGYPAVAVGAGEAGVNGQLLHPRPETPAKIVTISVVSHLVFLIFGLQNYYFFPIQGEKMIFFLYFCILI